MSGVVSKFDIPTSFVVQLETYEKKLFRGTSDVRMTVEITFAGGVMSVIQISRSGIRTTVVTVSVSTHKPKFVRNGKGLCMQFWNRETHSVLANPATQGTSEPLTIYMLDNSKTTILGAWVAEGQKVTAQTKAGVQQFRDIREKLAQQDEVQVRHEAEIDTLKKEQKEQKTAAKMAQKVVEQLKTEQKEQKTAAKMAQKVVEQLKTEQKTAAKEAAKKMQEHQDAVNKKFDGICRSLDERLAVVDDAQARQERAAAATVRKGHDVDEMLQTLSHAGEAREKKAQEQFDGILRKISDAEAVVDGNHAQFVDAQVVVDDKLAMVADTEVLVDEKLETLLGLTFDHRDRADAHRDRLRLVEGAMFALEESQDMVRAEEAARGSLYLS